MPTSTVTYLYGHDCLGESRDDEWLYYLNDGIGYVRQGADVQGQVVSSWLFDPDGAVLEGPQGPVSHLICGGVYDWSTGLIFRDGRYFDPTLGIWLALAPLVVVQSWQGRKRKRRRGMPWYVVVLVVMGVGSGVLTACNPPDDTPTPDPGPGKYFCYLPYIGKGGSPPLPEEGEPQSPLPGPPQEESSEEPSGKIAYLTFDDGPEPQGWSKAIGERLASQGMEATFFLIGADPGEGGMQRILGYPGHVQAIRDSGHAIGIHGWFHEDWTTPGYDYLGSVRKTHEALLGVLGTLDDKLIRAPGGHFPPKEKIPFEGYEDWYYYHWTIRGNPEDDNTTPASKLVELVEGKLREERPDNIIMLFHSIREGTYNAIVHPEKQGQYNEDRELVDPGDDLIWLLKEYGYTEFRKLPRPGDQPGEVIMDPR
jgi:peptidoglycan/xylan/chitin deacetylase (PgdA/CDA1 family)